MFKIYVHVMNPLVYPYFFRFVAVMTRHYRTCKAVSVKVKPVDIVRCVEEVRNDYKADDAG